VHQVTTELFTSDFGFTEPMPDFTARYPHKLESCLETPFGKYGRQHFYPGLLKKASALFYFCIKDHPFENGNKRFAVSAMLCLLFLNDKWLYSDPVALYKLAKYIADIRDRPPEVVIAQIAIALKPHMRSSPSVK
jgi:death-on-curing family protein